MPKAPTTHRTPTENAAALARVEALAADADPGEDDDTDDLTEPIPVWTAPQPGDYAPPDKHGHHAHDGERELHAQGDLPHYHDPDSGILVFFDVPVADGDGAPSVPPADGAGAHADPTPAIATGASADSQPRDGDRAGAGRSTSLIRDPRGRFTKPPATTLPDELACFEHAVIEAEDTTYRYERDVALRGAYFDAQLEQLDAEAERLEEMLVAVHAGAPWYSPNGGAV